MIAQYFKDIFNIILELYGRQLQQVNPVLSFFHRMNNCDVAAQTVEAKNPEIGVKLETFLTFPGNIQGKQIMHGMFGLDK